MSKGSWAQVEPPLEDSRSGGSDAEPLSGDSLGEGLIVDQRPFPPAFVKGDGVSKCQISDSIDIVGGTDGCSTEKYVVREMNRGKMEISCDDHIVSKARGDPSRMKYHYPFDKGKEG